MTHPGNAIHDPEKVSLLVELACSFSEKLDFDELLPEISGRTKDVLRAESCAILLLDDERNELYFPVVSDLSHAVEERIRETRVPADQGIAGWVVQTGKATVIPDAQRDDRFYSGVDHASGVQTRSLVYAPLRTRNGIIGVVSLRNKEAGVFTEEDLAFLEALAGPIAIAIENAQLYAKVKTSEERLRTEVGALRRDLARHDRFREIVGVSKAMHDVFALMQSAASSPVPVLIQGETGTGKELVARAIHRESERGKGPFLALNCAAVPETLLESELFGHRRGAFTGALHDKRGLFEAASGGTIFLDEIAEMPPGMQAKLLRVLQESELVPLGDTRPRRVDVRVISATNRDVAQAVAEKRFREDLYYRLGVFPIVVPPLRDRREDVPLLLEKVLAASAERHGKKIRGIDPQAMELLTQYEWPGNVRELQNEIERSIALAADGEVITTRHLSEKLRSAEPARAERHLEEGEHTGDSPLSLRNGRAAFEARHIESVLDQTRGNVTRAARILGLSRVSLYKKLRSYGLR